MREELGAFVRDEKAVAEFLAYWRRTFHWDVEPAVPMMKATPDALDRDVKLKEAREALIDETRCEECRGTGSRTTEAGVEDCGGCDGTGEYVRSDAARAALKAVSHE